MVPLEPVSPSGSPTWLIGGAIKGQFDQADGSRHQTLVGWDEEKDHWDAFLMQVQPPAAGP